MPGASTWRPCTDGLVRRGYEHGPLFQAVRGLWRLGEEILAEVAVPEDEREEAQRFGLHPALLDAALHPALLDAAVADGDLGCGST
ncbi:polyketide synthase dehydratase domain-containing protein [Streptomyces tricolor]|nr:polyketide synthase dehydratase domain-containing protein [Streptomyces tricolor]